MALFRLKNFYSIFRDVLFLWITALGINSITFLYIFFKIRPENSTFALHYNVLIGVDSLGKATNLYFIPVIAFLILAVNFTIFRKLQRPQPLLAFFCVFVSVFVESALLLHVVLLTSVN